MQVAVVWNSDVSRVIYRLGQPCPEKYGPSAVQDVLEALQQGGHTAALLEGDTTLLERLSQFLPPQIDGAMPTGMVFNMAYGLHGNSRYTHLPAMLEMAGVPYTGADPLGHAIALDKVTAKTLMREAGVPTPEWFVARRNIIPPFRMEFPLIVKPRHESTSHGLQIVHDRNELDKAVVRVTTCYRQEALVEQYIDGREIYVALLGNGTPECLPPVEVDFGVREPRTCTLEDKMHLTGDGLRKICPAAISGRLDARIQELAVTTFRACHCRDYARVDMRVDADDNPYVLEINSMASLGAGASYVLAATRAGYTLQSLVCRIVDLACQRCLEDVTPVCELETDRSATVASPIVSTPTNVHPTAVLETREEPSHF